MELCLQNKSTSEELSHMQFTGEAVYNVDMPFVRTSLAWQRNDGKFFNGIPICSLANESSPLGMVTLLVQCHINNTTCTATY